MLATELKRIYLLILLISLLFCGHVNAQDARINESNEHYLEPEIMMGKIVPIRSHFPSSPFISSFSLSFAKINYSTDNNWSKYYNYPSVGLSFAATNLGNNQVFGNEFTAMTFIQFKWSRYKTNCSYFKCSIGASYFTRQYGPNDPTNFMIGSPFTWAFQLNGYRYLYHSKNIHLKVGLGYLHNSNGHIQLPNLGLNSATASISAQLFTDNTKPHLHYPEDANTIDHTLHYFIQSKNGIGLQELGGKTGPAGTPKKGVYTFSMAGGVVFNQHIKVRMGLAYRYYKQYHDYIIKTNDSTYIAHPDWNASNVFVHVGCEFLITHFSIDIEEGINLYKPFYKTFYKRFESGPSIDYTLKSLITGHLALNYYLFNMAKNPKNNIFIGANINANMGQADFSEISFGFVHNIK